MPHEVLVMHLNILLAKRSLEGETTRFLSVTCWGCLFLRWNKVCAVRPLQGNVFCVNTGNTFPAFSRAEAVWEGCGCYWGRGAHPLKGWNRAYTFSEGFCSKRSRRSLAPSITRMNLRRHCCSVGPMKAQRTFKNRNKWRWVSFIQWAPVLKRTLRSPRYEWAVWPVDGAVLGRNEGRLSSWHTCLAYAICLFSVV